MGEHIRRIASENKNVQVHIRYSQPPPEDTAGRDYDEQGHVDVELLQRLHSSRDCDFYLCGPGPLMKSLFDGLLDWGVPESPDSLRVFRSGLCAQGQGEGLHPEAGRTGFSVLRRCRGHLLQIRCKNKLEPFL